MTPEKPEKPTAWSQLSEHLLRHDFLVRRYESGPEALPSSPKTPQRSGKSASCSNVAFVDSAGVRGHLDKFHEVEV